MRVRVPFAKVGTKIWFRAPCRSVSEMYIQGHLLSREIHYKGKSLITAHPPLAEALGAQTGPLDTLRVAQEVGLRVKRDVRGRAPPHFASLPGFDFEHAIVYTTCILYAIYTM